MRYTKRWNRITLNDQFKTQRPFLICFGEVNSPASELASYLSSNNLLIGTPSDFAIRGRYSARIIFRPANISLII